MLKRLLIAAAIFGSLFTQFSCSDDKNETVSFEQNYKDGMNFLLENMEREGVITTESGLQYEVIREGTGKNPSATDKVRCHYQGSLIDGKIFDSSYNGEPIVFALNQVIPGWTEGLQLMKEGAKHRLYIPYYLGYGAAGAAPSIMPYSTLIFDVELIEVIK